MTAGIDGEPLHIEATDDLSGVAGIQVNGLLFTALENGSIDVQVDEALRSYAKLAIRAYDFAGNFSPAVILENPYYGYPATPTPAPTATPKPTVKPTKAPSGGGSASKAHRQAHGHAYGIAHRFPGGDPAHTHARVYPDRPRPGLHPERQHANGGPALCQQHQ